MSSLMRTTLLIATGTLAANAAVEATLHYPPAPKTNQVDDYHGVKISDPYRSLENADAPTTQKWVDDQNTLTQAWLAKQPGREAIHAQLSALWNYEKFSHMYKAGGRYFYSWNTGLQNQAVIYTMDSLNGTPRLLLDPNTYRKDGTAAIGGQSVSWNGKLFGYSVAQAGSDWQEWHIRDVATGKDLPDTIQWSKSGGISWAPDDKGFYYSRFPEPPPGKLLTVEALNEAIYFHVLGTPQSEDKLIYARKDHPNWSFSAAVMEGGRWVLVYAYAGVPGKNMLSFIDLMSPNPQPVDLIATNENEYDPIAVIGSTLYLQTNDSAPRGRVVSIDLAHPDRRAMKEVVPQTENTLDAVVLANGKLLLSYMKDAHSVALLRTLDARNAAEIEMPGLGTASWSGAQLKDKEVFFEFNGPTVLPGLYRLDLDSGKAAPFKRSKVAFDVSNYETKQVFYKSKDGTRVPMTLSYRKGIKLDGSNPTLLYAYGGFDISETPLFAPTTAQWMQMGGIYAVANIRGGSEYGEEWHQAGMRGKKQNVFDDFIAAAEWLIANKYTSTPKLAINGGSNGGLLIGAVLNQRPDLFGAAMPAVGVMDMLRFQHFGFGTQWVGEYGSADNKADFPVLRAYSPLHNIRQGGHYPPTLITTSDHDDRVMPGHSLKYTATLQQAQAGTAPILLRVETRAGHGAGKPTSKRIDEWTDRFTFLKASLKM
jgi:prolyl oligopeptidase